MKIPTSVQFAMVVADDQAEVDLSDPFRPTGPYGVAKACEAKIAELEAARDALPRSGQRAINKRLRQMRQVMRWCRTREGYVEPPQILVGEAQE